MKLRISFYAPKQTESTPAPESEPQKATGTDGFALNLKLKTESASILHFDSNRRAGSTTVRSGTRDVQVVEPPDAIRTVLVRWKSVKIDLTKLAKLRWVEKRSVQEIGELTGKRRSTIQTSMRTLRKNGISELNLTKSERKLVQKQIDRENAVYSRKGS
jgi:biotin operon repressor